MTKTRDSNMELLRITAMLFILLIHATYRALPFPDSAAIEANATSSFLLILSRSAFIMGVNLFVMLSGWFGIRPRLSRLTELLFQVLFFGIFCFIVDYAIVGHSHLSVVESIKSFFLLREGTYWFIKCYLALYLFAPILNAFVEQATKRQFFYVLCSLFGFQFYFGWIFEATTWLRAGYSLPFFMCLYLLARYMRVHQPRFAQFNRKTDLAIYLGIVSTVTIMAFTLRHFNLGGFLFFYNSPTTILSAAYLLLFFSKIRFNSKVVNWLAVSTVAIYLTHSSDFLARYYDGAIRQWFYTETRPVFILYVTMLIIFVFFGSILIDKVRQRIWKVIERFLQSVQSIGGKSIYSHPSDGSSGSKPR